MNTKYRVDSFQLTRQRNGYAEPVGVAVLWRKDAGGYSWQLHGVELCENTELVMAQAANPDLEATVSTMAHDKATRRLAEYTQNRPLGDDLVAPLPAVLYSDQRMYLLPPTERAELERYTTMQGVRDLLTALVCWDERTHGTDVMDTGLLYGLMLGIWEDELLQLLDRYVGWQSDEEPF